MTGARAVHVLWALFVLAACRVEPRAGEPAPLVVFAAASLKESFEEISRDFERARPGTAVTLSLAGSQQLRLQLEHGAAADVFASADGRTMDALVAGGLAAGPRAFARNRMVVVVPAANPAGLKELADLPKARRIVLADASVPAGAYAAEVLDRAAAAAAYGPAFRQAVLDRVVSRELNVRQVVGKVALGEADAAIAYATDALASGEAVQAIPVPDTVAPTPEYPLAALRRSAAPELAAAFVEHVLSPSGQAALARHGFLPARP
jgi:molybdate transport system substrate-binding protein